MSQSYPGGFITRNQTPTTGGWEGRAPGMWTLAQALQRQKIGAWPMPAAPSGAIWAWGNNRYGALGLTDTAYRSSPCQVGFFSNWVVTSAGSYHNAAIQTNNTLWTWGENSDGQLGLGYRYAEASAPVQVGLLTNWLSVSCGFYHTTAIKLDGSLWTWGSNNCGQLGLMDYTWQSSPTQVGSLTTWSSVDGGYTNTMAIKNDGTLWAWGGNWAGQLGLDNTTYYNSPVQVGILTTWLNVSAGWYHTMAARNDGKLWAWGNNWEGQLGLDDTQYKSSPVQIGSQTNWLNLSAGYYHTLATTKTSALLAWGGNYFGQLGLGTAYTYANRLTPTQVGNLTTWSTLFPGGGAARAIQEDNSLWVWGIGRNGALGLGDTIYRSSPVQLGSLIPWRNVSTGNARDSSIATKTDGTLWSWGWNNNGQLGLDNVISYSSPVQVGALTTWLKASSGYFHSMAIQDDNTLWAWGYNLWGQLGLVDADNRSSPVQVGILNTWSSVSCGGLFTMALQNDNTLWSWGGGYISGVTGTGTNIYAQVAPPSTWSCVSAGTSHTLGIRTDGTLWAWGFNGWGQLGLGDTANRLSPVQVGLLTSWSSVSSGNNTTVALKNDGTLWACGMNSDGSLGQGDYINRSSPVQVGVLTTWAEVSCPGGYIIAKQSDGSLWSWGDNWGGYLGLGDAMVYNNMSSPTQVGSDSNWLKISAGHYHSLATRNNNTLWSWGQNYNGQLGLPDFTTYYFGWRDGNKSSPTQIGALTTWLSVSAGKYHSLAIGAPKPPPARIYGTTTVGFTLTCTIDGWTTYPTPVISYQWKRGITNIGTNADTYLLVDADIGSAITCVVTSVNSKGTLIGTSNILGPINPAQTLWSWGRNNNGQLAQNDIVDHSSPIQVGTGVTWSKISESMIANGQEFSHVLAIQADGSLWSWGRNWVGELGLGDAMVHGGVSRSSPVQVGILTDWLKIATGYVLSLAIKKDGTLWSWGGDWAGALGLNTYQNRSSPVQVGSGTTWSSIAAGYHYSLATKTDGTLWSWGYGQFGELGLSDPTTARSTPVQVGVLTNWSEVTSGIYFVLATKLTGTLWSWGDNISGGLGLNDSGGYWWNVNTRSSPTQVGSASNWSKISAGYEHVLATNTNGELYTWGGNYYGQLGLNDAFTYASTSSPTQIGLMTDWAQVSSGGVLSAAIKTDHTLWTWGMNDEGPLGLGDIIYRSSPVQVGSLADWAKVSAGGAALAIKTDNTLWAWGQNWHGELGLNNPTRQFSSPTQVGILTDWSDVSTGFDGTSPQTLAIKTDNTLWAWGGNTFGELGFPGGGSVSSPTQVGSLATWNKIATGQDFSAAIKLDKTLWMFGRNGFGNLGLNDTSNKYYPTQLGVETTWETISLGSSHSMGIKTGGTLWVWGDNSRGQLGLNNLITQSNPVQVGILTDWASVDAGEDVSMAIKTDGTLWSWGTNQQGQLGLGDSTPWNVYTKDRSSPTQIGILTNWLQVSTDHHSLAIKTNGTAWSWGWNFYGTLGLGEAKDRHNRSTPTQVGLLTNWLTVSAGYEHSAATSSDGKLWTWGRNVHGELGFEDGVSKSSPTQVGILTSWKDSTAGKYSTLAISSLLLL